MDHVMPKNWLSGFFLIPWSPSGSQTWLEPVSGLTNIPWREIIFWKVIFLFLKSQNILRKVKIFCRKGKIFCEKSKYFAKSQNIWRKVKIFCEMSTYFLKNQLIFWKGWHWGIRLVITTGSGSGSSQFVIRLRASLYRGGMYRLWGIVGGVSRGGVG